MTDSEYRDLLDYEVEDLDGQVTNFTNILYEQLFRTKVFCEAFMCFWFWFAIFCSKKIGTKAACQMLVSTLPTFYFFCIVKIILKEILDRNTNLHNLDHQGVFKRSFFGRSPGKCTARPYIKISLFTISFSNYL